MIIYSNTLLAESLRSFLDTSEDRRRLCSQGIIVRKCSETVVGLEILDGLSTGLRCSLKQSLCRPLVSPM